MTRIKYLMVCAAALSLVSCETNAQTDAELTGDEVTDVTDTDPIAQPASRALHLSMNDVSILVPAPETPQDITQNILRLTDFEPDRVLPEDRFQQVMQIVTGPSMITTPAGELQVDAGKVVKAPGTQSIFPIEARIGFPGQNLRQDWALAGIRIDPGAPGLSSDTFNTFGKSPQIRLTLQPINAQGNNVKITDGSLHLVYAFHGADDLAKVAQCPLHNSADMDGFSDAMDDLIAIKTKMATNHNIDTDGKPLSIHPAFATAGSVFKEELRVFLNTHLTPDRLFAVSIAAIPENAPEPWVFVAMQQHPVSGRIEAVPSPATIQPGPMPTFGQMISFVDRPQVQPAPATRNRQAVDCLMNFPGPVPAQLVNAGVSTSTVFDFNDPDILGISATVADPVRSHFFNTDCVSCHTETRKEIDMNVSTPQQIAAQSNIDPAVLPDGQWNVRAFGWFPGFPARASGAHETATRRAATETKEVLECFETDNWHRADVSCL